jgi:hypothetical protein
MPESFETIAKELTLAILEKVEKDSRKTIQDYANDISEVYKTVYKAVKETTSN